MLRIRHIDQQSETSLVFYFHENTDSTAGDLSLLIANFADQHRNPLSELGIIELIPCSHSLYVEFQILKAKPQLIEQLIRQNLQNFKPNFILQETLELPIYYHPDVAPDLKVLADKNGLSTEQVISIHSQTSYTVASLGFAPGFAYLSGLDHRLATPRLSSPKPVPKGSLGIADKQTAIYPDDSPGGWSIIGKCPIPLVDLSSSPITPFATGMTVKFSSINREDFLKLGGQL